MKKILIFFTLLATTTLAEVKTQLISAKVIKNDKGIIEKVEATNAYPGDILEYTFIIDNQEEEIIKNLNPAIPVPSGTTLVPKTGKPSNYLVSINGRDYYPYPIEVNGEPIELSNYKSIGWNVNELKPGEKAEFQMQVKLNGGEKQ